MKPDVYMASYAEMKAGSLFLKLWQKKDSKTDGEAESL